MGFFLLKNLLLQNSLLTTRKLHGQLLSTGKKCWTFRVEGSGEGRRDSCRVNASYCMNIEVHSSWQSFPSVESNAVHSLAVT